mmetsp:Transcript_35023/g.87211  ORF Transcript_35023/g.87211 Transcript_35023/m.87211 type:complete len:327 (+) Transcript_35023:18-998(+)
MHEDAEEADDVLQIEKVAGEPLHVVLEQSMVTGRVTISDVAPNSPALGILAPGDSILQVNGVKVQSCDHAALLIKEGETLRLRVIPSKSKLAAIFGIDCADMFTMAQMMRKAFLLACCCSLVFLVLPMHVEMARVKSSKHQIEETSRINQLALGGQLASKQKLLLSEHTKHEHELRTVKGELQSKAQLIASLYARHTDELQKVKIQLANVKHSLLALEKHNATLSKEHLETEQILQHAQEELRLVKENLKAESARASKLASESSHHNRTVASLRRRDALLQQQFAAAVAAISKATSNLDAAPFPPPPPAISATVASKRNKGIHAKR